MGRRKKRFFENLSIDGMSSEGMGIGRVEDRVVFVEQAVPGDVVDALESKKRSKFSMASIRELKTKSELRVDPFCDHFGLCGGCKWQFLPYEEQLKFKQQIVEDAFKRIAKVEPKVIHPILEAPSDRRYRNKMEFTFSNKRWLTQDQIDSGEEFNRNGLGFHIKGFFDKVVHIEECHLQKEPSNAIRNAIGDYANEKGIEYFDLREQTGILRNLFIKITEQGEILVLLSVAKWNDDVEALLEHIKSEFPEVTSLQYVVNDKRNDTIYDLECKVFHGSEHIHEQLGDFKFKIGPKSFFQTNSQQAGRLYARAKEMANLNEDTLLYDLYTGVGSIGIYMSDRCKTVVGLETIPEAIEDAKWNAKLNNLDQCHFYAGDVKDLLTNDLIKKHGKPDVLITDPPRAGMHQDVVQMLLDLEISRLVYISCNPATQARDIQLLHEKYELDEIQAVDMFPQTTHIENIACLTLR